MSLRISPVLIFGLACAGFSASGIAQVDHSTHAKPATRAASKPPDIALSDGRVKKIDRNNQRLTIAHDSLPNGMPAMTMTFSVKVAEMLDKVYVGQKIRFATASADSTMVVHLERVK